MREEAIQKSDLVTKAVRNHFDRVKKDGHYSEARCLEDVCYWILESGDCISKAELRAEIEKDILVKSTKMKVKGTTKQSKLVLQSWISALGWVLSLLSDSEK